LIGRNFQSSSFDRSPRTREENAYSRTTNDDDDETLRIDDEPFDYYRLRIRLGGNRKYEVDFRESKVRRQLARSVSFIIIIIVFDVMARLNCYLVDGAIKYTVFGTGEVVDFTTIR